MITEIYIDGIPLEEHIQNEVDRQKAEYPVIAFFNGERVDIDACKTENGETRIDFNGHLYFPDSERIGIVDKINPAEMAKMAV